MSTRANTSLQFGVPSGTRVADLTASDRVRLFQRGGERSPQVSRAVTEIIDQVRERGDVALRELAVRFDGVELTSLEVSAERCRQALTDLDPDLQNALRQAAASIRAFHGARAPLPYEIEVQRGVKIGRRPEALASVGVYAPGGQAAYPSSVLMGVLPARIAGVSQVIVCTPAGSTGEPAGIVLAACALAGADRVFALGGAGAIAALSFGTRSVPRVDKIVGPGNVWVTEAKRQLVGNVAIDCPAGPSEILILADDSADAETIARELIAQSEHDADAASVLVTTRPALVDEVRARLERALPNEPRAALVAASFADNGALLVAQDETEMLEFAETYAPEHLVLLTSEPRRTLERVRNAGSVFLGASSSVAFGDYLTGANHVLPTGGRARAYSGLSTEDFVRWFTYQEVSAAAAGSLAEPTAALAGAEGLPAHASAAQLRAPIGNDTRDGGPVLRPIYRTIGLYDPERSDCAVDLSDNTNLFGSAPSAERALSATVDAEITRYPAVFAEPLKQAIAEWYRVPPENVVTGCGCDDMIDSGIRAFCEAGDRLVFPIPTFVMVSHFARVNGVEPFGIALSPNLTVDPDQLIAAAGRVTYLCNPNNPTGTTVPAEVIQQLQDRVPGVLLLDEAYAEFAGTDFAQAAASSERMISLRTFSKAFGLAGLRIGFAIGPAALVREIEKSRGPYKVSSAAINAAVAVLQHDRDWVRARVEEACTQRERLFGELEQRGYRPIPSAANFLLVPVPAGQRAASLSATLRAGGIMVRPFADLPGLGDCIRVTIGPWSMMQRFLAALPGA